MEEKPLKIEISNLFFFYLFRGGDMVQRAREELSNLPHRKVKGCCRNKQGSLRKVQAKKEEK